jgi:HD-GYP domain-containing protein (c-di-GMP phosphodiesterase class II)
VRAISIDSAAAKQVLGKNIYTPDGRVLLRQGTALTERYIKALRDLKFSHIYVRDERLPDLDVDDVIPEDLRLEAVQAIEGCFADIRKQLDETGKVNVNVDAVAEMSKSIVENLMSNKDLVVQLMDLRSLDSYTFAHSVNCCVLGVMMGQRLGLPEPKLKDLATGLVLLDIGKCVVPAEILSKPGPLSEEEFAKVKEHSRAGFDALREVFNVSAHSKIVVLQHHERIDGSGYPKGLKGPEIHLYGQIAALADVFDALTSDRVYRKRLLPHEAIDVLLRSADRLFDRQLVTTFVANIAPFPKGTLVKLSSGEHAIVNDFDMSAALRPTVAIVKDSGGRDLKAPFPLLDLRRDRSVAIVKVLAE